MNVHDVAIVGAGPIGLELAVALKKQGVDYVQFDARQIGHTISWWAPQTRWFSSNDRISIAGVPLVTPDGNKCTREQYLAYLRSVVTQFDLKVRTFSPVIRIAKTGDGLFMLTIGTRTGEETCAARRVVLATGGTERPRMLGIPGEELPHVTHYFGDPHQYFGQRVMIVGGRNSAAEAALRCHQAGAMVSLSYRQATLPTKSIKYWLLPELQGLIDSGKITAHFNSTPVEISAQSIKLQHEGGTVKEWAADFVLLLVGYEADMTLFKMAGVQLEGDCEVPVFSSETMETSVSGLYVAGTAAAGTQDRYALFLENAHVHVERIVAHLQGKQVHLPTPMFSKPES